MFVKSLFKMPATAASVSGRQILGARSLVATQQRSFAKIHKPMQTIAMHVDSQRDPATPDQFSIDFRLASQVKIDYNLDTQLQEVHDALVGSTNNEIKSARFFNLNGS